MAATLSKEERLSGKTAVAALMTEGSWAHYGHFKYCILRHDGEGLNRIMVSVPKKHFKRAVKRNLLKGGSERPIVPRKTFSAITERTFSSISIQTK